jgi:UDP-2,3-diacylglucosamine pyrophosphatase LpxH
VQISNKNVLMILILVAVNVLAFILGGYYALMPILFVIGFTVICIADVYVSISWRTKNLAVLVVSAIVVSFVDEFAHTSAGTLTYYDHAIPSLLTVFGWSIFMIFLAATAKFTTNIHRLQIADKIKLRTLPVFMCLILILTVSIAQNYLRLFNWALILLYLLLFTASFYYTSTHSLKWNILTMILSIVFGLVMEYLGGMEGLWTFRFQEPVSLLILFSWPLRFWTVNALCYIAGVDFVDQTKKPPCELSAEIDKDKSIIVVADTHFGLKKKDETSNPEKFSDFLKWIDSLEQKGTEKIGSGIWSNNEEKTIIVKKPEKLIFTGDILEFWDASKESIDVCTRSIIQSLYNLKSEKIYLLGNHDQNLTEISDNYPLGNSNVLIKEGEYATSKGEKRFVFLHGHEFDKLFSFPSWRLLPYINQAANVFRYYSLIFVVLFVVDFVLLFSIGFTSITDWLMLLALGAFSIPFLFTQLGRNVWNSVKTTKFKPIDAEKGLVKWWSSFKGEIDPGEWNLVYGHTHVMGLWSKIIDDSSLTMYNLPSWVKDTRIKSGIYREEIFRNGFLYIDNQLIEFIGWDSEKKKPFFIPKNLILARRTNKDLREVDSNIETELQKIGWPQKLVNKWLKSNLGNRNLA